MRIQNTQFAPPKAQKPFWTLFFAFLFSLLLNFTPLTPIFATPTEQHQHNQPEQTEQPNPTPQNQPPSPSNPEQNPQNPNTTQPENSSEIQPDGQSKSDQPEKSTKCADQIQGVGWLICPIVQGLGSGIDALYSAITNILEVKPFTFDSSSQISIIWRYFKDITNIVFIILMIIVVYSQITGIGLSNYNIKTILPRIVVASILINLSFLLCALAVDISNIIGSGLYGFFRSVEQTAMQSGPGAGGFSWGATATALLLGTGTIAGTAIAVSASGGLGALLWLFIPTVFAAFIAVVTGLFTVAARQAVIALLVMVSPLAFVAYLLPNTEKYFRKWKDIFTQMLIFYPLFSLLFGASSLAGWTIISSSTSPFGFILGLAVKVFPLFYATTLMKMSGTVLSTLNSALNKAAAPAQKSLDHFSAEKAAKARAEYYTRGARAGALTRNNLKNAGAIFYKKRLDKKFDRHQDMEEAIKESERYRTEYFNNLELGRRIIGYDKDNNPIFTQVPLRNKNGDMILDQDTLDPILTPEVQVTKQMKRKFNAKVHEVQLDGSNAEVQKQYSAMSSYLDTFPFDKNSAEYKQMKALAAQNLENFLTLNSHKEAIASNDAADARYLHDRIATAAKRDDNGNIINKAEYEKMITRSAGYDGISDDESTREAALTKVVAKSYNAAEAERAIITKNYVSYGQKQVTKEVERIFHSFINDRNIEGMTAMAWELRDRGDLDKVSKPLAAALDQMIEKRDEHGNVISRTPYVELGTDFANSLAHLFLSMKNVDPGLARFGKHMLVETAAFMEGKRKTSGITMQEYFTGEIVNGNGEKTKGTIVDYISGTPFDGIDRTAYASTSQLMDQYWNDNTPENIARREAFYKNKLAQLITAMPKFASGSEQIVNTMTDITGIKKASDGSWKRASGYNAISDQEFSKMTDIYLSALTANNIINMKTDSIESVIAKLTYDIKNANPHMSDADVQQAVQNKYVNSFSQTALEVLAFSPDLSTMKGKNFNYLKDKLEAIRQSKTSASNP